MNDRLSEGLRRRALALAVLSLPLSVTLAARTAAAAPTEHRTAGGTPGHPTVGATPTDASVSSANAADLAEVARSVPRGASMRIEGARFDGFADAAGLELKRFEVVAPGARFRLQTEDGPREIRPDLPVYLRGSVDGMRGSVAVLSVRPSGEVRGVVSGADGTWLLGRRAGVAESLRSRRVDRQALADDTREFACGQVESARVQRPALASASASASATAERSLRLPIVYTAQIAVELDFDFYSLFSPDPDAAMLYALDLMAFTGALGESELGMNVQVPYLDLWTTSSDPYTGSDFVARLQQFRSRWNQSGASNCSGTDCTTIDRSTAILMSAATNGGAAYVPGLCDSYHSPTGGFSYAFAGSMSGDFDVDSPSVVWDIVVATHELGHNFGSPHTHCYDPPVDTCHGGESGCYSGPTSLPSGCGGPGQGCATLMSYCHLLAGGGDNLSLTYGAGHPYGDAPERVPNTMISRLATEAAFAPACLTATGGMVTLDVTIDGSGSGTVTSSPPGIDCGNGCETYFDADTVVTLTPTPGTFSEFTGWSGDPDCNDGVVTLSAARSCVATFDGSCGAGNEDCDDGDPCTTDSCPADDHCENTGTPRDAATCFESPRTKLKIVDSPDPNKDKVQWQWRKGEAFAQADLGDPSATTDYALCVYDTTGGVSSLATSFAIEASAAGWKDRTPDGWKWSDRDGLEDGIRKLDLRTGVAGRTSVKLKGAGALLPLPGAFSGSEYFDEDTSVVAQLLSSDGSCWTSSFSATGTSRNTPAAFNASGN